MCSICEHEHRKEIDLLIMSGESARSIAKRWSVSAVTVRAHKRDCMSRTDQMLIEASSSRVAGILAPQPYETTTTLLDAAALQKAAYHRLMGIADKVEGRVDACIAKGEDRNLAPLVQSLIRSIESALGRNQGGVVNNFIAGDIRQSKEWQAMMLLCDRHPELQDELLSYLSQT